MAKQSLRSVRIANRAEVRRDRGADAPAPFRDVRLKRELAYRRLVISMLRRLARVLTLHILDAGIIIATALIASRVASSSGLLPLLPTLVAVYLLSLNGAGAYSPGEARRDRRRLLSGVVLGSLILYSISLFPPSIDLSLPLVGGHAILLFVFLAVGRGVADQLVRQAYVRGIGLRRAVVIGNLDEVSQAIQQLRDERNIDQYIVGHLAPDNRPDPTALGSVSELAEVLEQHDIQEVVLATSLRPQAVRRVSNSCFERGTQLYVFPSVLGTVDCRVEPLYVGSCPLMQLSPADLRLPGLLVKRGIDLLLASIALILLAPAMIAVALAIKVDSRGPVFFRQQRVGLGARTFTIWKFRSMYLDSESQRKELGRLNAYGNPRLFKIHGDPRITRVGRFLRRTSLDELPQLFNVLSGEMSLVGPRPPLPSEVETYEPHHFERLTVVPGITGPWQVGGRNLITDFEKVVRMERAYIRSWSLVLDMKIMLRTVKVVITGEGAY